MNNNPNTDLHLTDGRGQESTNQDVNRRIYSLLRLLQETKSIIIACFISLQYPRSPRWKIVSNHLHIMMSLNIVS